MYPRNSASPERIAIGAVIQISDGAPQGSGVSITVQGQNGSEAAGAGTIAYGATGVVVYYTPTQAETNFTSFTIVASKSGCIPVSQTIVTTASATPGRTVPSGGTIDLAGSGYTAPPSASTVASQVRTELTTELARLDAAISTRAVPGAAMSLTTEERNAFALVLEAVMVDEEIGEELRQSIADKIIENMPDINDLTLAAISAGCRDAILNRVLAGNHDEAGSTGKLLQDAATAVTSGAHGNAALKTIIDTKASQASVDDVPNNSEFAAAIAPLATAAALTATDGKVDQILADTGTDGVVLSAATLNAIAAALLDLTDGIESGVTLRQAQRAMAAVLAGRLPSGAGTDTEAFKGIGQPADGTTRATFTVDEDGNRTNVVLNL